MCLRTQNWRTTIPYVLIDAHIEAGGESAETFLPYFKRPEVWEDVRSAQEGYLINFPDDHFCRSKYAVLAGQCARWDVAHKQFEMLGDHADMRAFGSVGSYEFYRGRPHDSASRTRNPPSPSRPAGNP